ncbi:MAG: hypothetical protein QNK23_17675 [Crocinitomicaceae bacterium]|nr:hypothetical protein [Crocinitomicaceae bacterium]
MKVFIAIVFASLSWFSISQTESCNCITYMIGEIGATGYIAEGEAPVTFTYDDDFTLSMLFGDDTGFKYKGIIELPRNYESEFGLMGTIEVENILDQVVLKYANHKMRLFDYGTTEEEVMGQVTSEFEADGKKYRFVGVFSIVVEKK